MSLDKCLDTLRAAGKIDPQREDQARKIYEEIRAALGDRLGADEAASKATGDTLDRLTAQAAEKRRQTQLQALRQQDIERNMRRFRTPDGQEDWSRAAEAHIDHDPAATFSNIEARRKAVLGDAHSQMVDVLATFRRDLFGRVRDDAKLDNVVRESFGESTGDASARELSHSWKETSNSLRQAYNEAGGHIAERRDWGLPQSHDMLAVRKAGEEEWKALVRERIDPNRMYDELTGQRLTPSEVERSLHGTYETIASGGWNAVEPSGVPISGKMANGRADPRFLAFKNADAWLQYHGRFSKGTPFDVMLEHMHGLSRDIAAMRVLGPNPSATLRWMEQMIQKHAVEADMRTGGSKRSAAATKTINRMRNMWAAYTGRSNAPVDHWAANAMAGTRSLLQSAQLGAAAISSLDDVRAQHFAARMSSIPATGILRNYLKLLRPTVTADQKLAVRLGLIAEGWSTMALAQARYADDVHGPEFTRRLSDAVMRVSGLSPWTQAGRWAFGMEFLGALADHSRAGIDKLPPALAKTLGYYGIDRESWDIIRKTPLYTERGATFLRPADIAKRADLPQGLANDLATRVLEMVQSQTSYAVPEGSLRGRVWLTGDTRPGTVPGEVLKSVAMYKNFGVTLTMMHSRRAAMEQGKAPRAAYFASLALGMLVAGATTYQLKRVAKGQTPLPMDDASFWGAAALQSGGAGIYGDFLFNDVNRYGNSMADTLAGPVVTAGSDVKNAVLGNAKAAAEGDKSNFGGGMVGLAEKYTPGGSLWYTRLAYQRLVLDQLRKQIDPHYQDHFRAMERRARKDVGGNGFWWRPGETAPEVARP